MHGFCSSVRLSPGARRARPTCCWGSCSPRRTPRARRPSSHNSRGTRVATGTPRRAPRRRRAARSRSRAHLPRVGVRRQNFAELVRKSARRRDCSAASPRDQASDGLCAPSARRYSPSRASAGRAREAHRQMRTPRSSPAQTRRRPTTRAGGARLALAAAGRRTDRRRDPAPRRPQRRLPAARASAAPRGSGAPVEKVPAVISKTRRDTK